MCRFFAHFCFFLQMIDIPVPLSSTKTIIESYLEVLEVCISLIFLTFLTRLLICIDLIQEAGQRELIAIYTGALGQDAVERYAMFLVSLALSADINERRLALTRARDHGLDMERIAIFTAERTIDNAFRVSCVKNVLIMFLVCAERMIIQVLPALRGPLPSIIARQASPSEAELILLRSIEWTTFSEDTFDTALEQANVILRYFLGKPYSFFPLNSTLILLIVTAIQPLVVSNQLKASSNSFPSNSGLFQNRRKKRLNIYIIDSSLPFGKFQRVQWNVNLKMSLAWIGRRKRFG